MEQAASGLLSSTLSVMEVPEGTPVNHLLCKWFLQFTKKNVSLVHSSYRIVMEDLQTEVLASPGAARIPPCQVVSVRQEKWCGSERMSHCPPASFLSGV